jgi:hypothetical protein
MRDEGIRLAGKSGEEAKDEKGLGDQPTGSVKPCFLMLIPFSA